MFTNRFHSAITSNKGAVKKSPVIRNWIPLCAITLFSIKYSVPFWSGCVCITRAHVFGHIHVGRIVDFWLENGKFIQQTGSLCTQQRLSTLLEMRLSIRFKWELCEWCTMSIVDKTSVVSFLLAVYSHLWRTHPYDLVQTMLVIFRFCTIPICTDIMLTYLVVCLAMYRTPFTLNTITKFGQHEHQNNMMMMLYFRNGKRWNAVDNRLSWTEWNNSYAHPAAI